MLTRIFDVRRSAAAAIALLMLVALCSPAMAQHGQMTPVLNSYFKMVFAGDVSGATALFASEPDDQGSQILAERFGQRFIERDDGLDLSKVEAPVVREIVQLFQTYWRDALMQAAPLDELEEQLKSRLNDILVSRGYERALDEDDLEDNVEALIREEGYFAKSGRTPPLLDLMIWTENEVTTELVELTDGVHEVELNQLAGFVSYGWSNFAAFGMTSTGGWAQEDGLYCLCQHYDLDSERFKLSFLKHEARHYADLELYPELQSSDLEYRAKLTELAFSDEGTYGLVEYFHKAANRVQNAPHPLANWYVIEGLSQELLDGEPPQDASGWESIPKEQIRSAARRLLEEHTSKLASMDAATATGVISI